MAYDPEQITFFAKTDARGQNVPFGIKAKDRTRHVYVIGKTGMGKSTLLENMAVQDMRNDNGLAFIDPHGATAETLLQYVPEDRVDDVLYFAPFDTEYPVAFNVMEDVGPEKRHLVAAGLMSVFKKIWVDAWSARMEYILQNTILALLEFPNSTLLGVNRMLSDKHYRKAVIDNISDPAVKSFWVDEFLNYNERYMQEAGDAIKNKIGQFTANPLIRNIIGQPHTSFDLRAMMDEKKILIANLSKGLIGEGNANLLGSMLTTRIYLAAMSRADLDPQTMKQMPNFYFYVDEFQSFANATFADILSEARKYHLNLTIAHQYIEQMEEEVRNAVFGNVGTIISFRVGPFDAEVLETIFAPQFYAADIVNLGFAQIYLTLMIDGIGSRPFSATTLPPIELPHVSCRDMVLARSRERFGSKRAVVEQTINDWMSKRYQPNDTQRPADRNQQRVGKAGAHTPRVQKSENTKTKSIKPVKKDKNQAQSKTQPVAANSTPGSTTSADESQKTNLDELRSVLRSIAGDDDEKTKTPVVTTATPSKNEQKSETPATNNSSAEKSLTRSKSKTKPIGTGTTLKDALVAVLAERTPARAVSDQTTNDATADTAEQPSTTDQPAATPKDANTTDNTTSISTSSVSPSEQTTSPTAEHVATPNQLDPKQIERMLRVTGADNSPFKKR